jgi:hypothetical protein
MIDIKKIGAQGDVLFLRVNKLPDNAQKDIKFGPAVIAHSETGHHHMAMRVPGVDLFTVPGDPMVCYLQLDPGMSVEIEHHRPWDTHETLRLLGFPKKKTVFEVRRQREYTPAGWRRVED